MFGSFLSVWTKLRRRALLLGVYGGAAAVAALITAVVFGNALPTTGPRFGPTQGVPLERLAGPGGLLAGLGSAATVLGVLALSVAAGTLAGDHAGGTLRNLLIRQPRRLRRLTGEWLGLVTFATGAVVVAAVASAVTAVAMSGAQDIDAAVWFTADGRQASLRTLAEVAPATPGFTTLGAAQRELLRAPVAAVAVGFAWLLPLENILANTVSGSDRWLPGQLLSAIARDGTPTVALGTAATTLAVYLAVAGAAAATAFVRRDVTA